MSLPRNLRLKSKLFVPIYECKVYLYVSHDALRTYKQAARAHGFPPEAQGFQAMAVTNDNRFGLFFHVSGLTNSLVAHEINHLTRMMVKELGLKTCKFCENDEFDSLLCGYLHEWVKRKLKKAHIRVA